MSQDRSTPDTSSTARLHVLGDGDRDESSPVTPVPVEDPAGDDPEEHVEYAHDGTELHCVVQGSEYANIHNVFTISNYCIWLPDWEPCGENDNVKKYADDIDRETEKDAVLIVRMNDAPDKGEKEEKIVDHNCLTSPISWK